MLNLNSIKALTIDMDGVLWRGESPLPGLTRFFDFLQQQNIPFMLATNNASKTPDQYQRKLAGLGVTIDTAQVMTSSLATADYLQNQIEPGSLLYAVGEDGLRQALQQAGFMLVDDASRPVAAVVAGIDFGLTYDTLKIATLLIQRGARFVGTNGDLSFPAEEGFLPGAGAILAAIEAATGVKPTTIGKPAPPMFEAALARLGTQPAETAMIGDRLETDISGGQQAGLKTILVTSGVDNRDSIDQKGITPDAIYSGIDALVEAWQAVL